MLSLEELLVATSRTFALAIPLLPEPERHDVTIGYLLFRIADTLEDAENLGRDDRIAGLRAFITLLDDPNLAAAEAFASEWFERHPSTNADYEQLIRQTPDVLQALNERPPAVKQCLIKHTQMSANGMAKTLQRADTAGNLACDNVEQLREYCYHVAGVVGEMLTELFELQLGESPATLAMWRHARWFGEGLQLVNILKDAEDDAAEGRAYLPARVPREDVFAIARNDLEIAEQYTAALEQAEAPTGYIAFTRLPCRLATATLEKLAIHGAGAKLTRPEVTAILQEVMQPLAAQEPANQSLSEDTIR